MKWTIFVIAFAGIAGLGFISWKKNHKNHSEVKLSTNVYPSVALLELFTSEGCSSCPPADKLLPELSSIDSNVISLSFHVDYWDRLGWKDPFSNSLYSDRQRQYGNQFHLESIYTPELVVNGQYELLGSDRAEATTAIKKALGQKSSIAIYVDDVTTVGGKLEVNCRSEGDLGNTDLFAALVQKKAMMNVKAGENQGATLSHTNVVRSLSRQRAQSKSIFKLNMPADLAADNWQIIVFAQEKTGKIIGAVQYIPGSK